jgi:hypothetical protein
MDENRVRRFLYQLQIKTPLPRSRAIASRGLPRSNKVIWEKINYVHNNPVEAGLVYRAQDYVYSSASDYSDEKGLLDGIVVFQYYG